MADPTIGMFVGDAEVQRRTVKVTDHAFEPSEAYPEGEGCTHIIEGAAWSISDPHRCRRAKREHVEQEVQNGSR